MVDRTILHPVHILLGLLVAGLGVAIFTGALAEKSLSLRVVCLTAMSLAVVVAVAQAYMFTTRPKEAVRARAIHAMHVLLVAPLLFALGYMGRAAPRFVSGAVVVLGSTATVYHALRTAQMHGVLSRA